MRELLFRHRKTTRGRGCSGCPRKQHQRVPRRPGLDTDATQFLSEAAHDCDDRRAGFDIACNSFITLCGGVSHPVIEGGRRRGNQILRDLAGAWPGPDFP